MMIESEGETLIAPEHMTILSIGEHINEVNQQQAIIVVEEEAAAAHIDQPHVVSSRLDEPIVEPIIVEQDLADEAVSKDANSAQSRKRKRLLKPQVRKNTTLMEELEGARVQAAEVTKRNQEKTNIDDGDARGIVLWV